MASARKRRRKSHDGKRAYDTQQQAQAAIAGMCRRRARQGEPIVSFMRAYRCGFCAKWHVGSSRSINWSKVRM